MRQDKLVFAQLIDALPYAAFAKCVKLYEGSYPPQALSYWSHLLCMLFAQYTSRHSLRDLVTCLNAQRTKLYRTGIGTKVARSTLSDANEGRDWRIFRDFGMLLIAQARALHVDEPLMVDVDESVYALDSTVMDLCLSLFPWAPASKGRAGVKVHTVLDLRGSIPTVLDITGSRISDVSFLDELVLEAGSIYIMDRGYMHAKRLMRFTQCGASFVVRTFADLRYRVVSANDTPTYPVLLDEIVRLSGDKTRHDYPVLLRRVVVHDVVRNKAIILLTNNFLLSAKQIGLLYKSRWKIELFFKCIKQHLRIKSFMGRSPNAVKIQIWTAISAYLLIAIIRKRLKCEAGLHEMLQTLSVTLFETTPLHELFLHLDDEPAESNRQISLFEKIAGQ